ncbi:restriction endonuclease subunit S [Cronobacter dublinensis]
MSDFKFHSPNSWILSSLPDIAGINMGQSPSSSDVNEQGEGIVFFQGKAEFGKLYPTPRKYCTKPTKIASVGDILLSIRAPVGPTNIATETTAIGRGLAAISAHRGLTDPKYLLYYFRCIEPWLSTQGTGSTFKAISGQFIKELKAPLPAFAEQKNIAEKLDALLAQVDSTKARLEQIPQILKRFRQAVLIAAFTKKLTESSEFTEKKISDVCSFQNGFAFKSSWFSKTGSYQVIKLANIRDGYLFLENAPAYVNEEQGVEFSKFSPNIGDVLISMTGTRFKKDYGFGCIMTQKHKALINQRVGRLIPIKASILPEYLFLFVRSELFREQFFKGETGGVNQGNVGSQHIQSILINVPPLTEQHEIVRRVEQLFAYADTIEKQVNSALARVNSLTQSILAKAFRGELTAQWRAENPDLISGENSAAALLEKIKAERAASSGKKAARKKA